LPPIAVPLGTYTGWNVYRAQPGELADRDGSLIPFARTKEERQRQATRAPRSPSATAPRRLRRRGKVGGRRTRRPSACYCRPTPPPTLMRRMPRSVLIKSDRARARIGGPGETGHSRRGDRMKRREFMLILGRAMATARALSAQQRRCR